MPRRSSLCLLLLVAFDLTKYYLGSPQHLAQWPQTFLSSSPTHVHLTSPNLGFLNLLTLWLILCCEGHPVSIVGCSPASLASTQ